MEINTALDRASSFAELLKIIDTVEPQLSWFASRYVSSPSYEGTTPIIALVRRVLAVRDSDFHFNEIERSHAERIMKKISATYEQSDLQVEQSGFITRFFAFLRGEGPSEGFNTTPLSSNRVLLFVKNYPFFLRYTEKQFQTVFGGRSVSKEEDRLDAGNTFLEGAITLEDYSAPRRWFVSPRYKEAYAKMCRGEDTNGCF